MPLLFLLVTSCEIGDEMISYDEKLVVFGSIRGGFPMLEPVRLSRSAEITEDAEPTELYINDADLFISSGGETIPLASAADLCDGCYLADQSFVFQSGETYTLHATHNGKEVSATTTVPPAFELSSPTDFEFLCYNESLPVPTVEVDNALFLPGSFLPLPDMSRVTDVVYRFGGCYTESFASFPLFGLEFSDEDLSTLRLTVLALEADEFGPEPFVDADKDGQFDIDSETWTDLNENGIYDSSYVNVIYDTSLASIVWKEPYLRDEFNNPYRMNPYVWNVSSTPLAMNWLLFNYWGLTLVAVESTDKAYYDYWSGDPFGENQYQLADSNIEGGYGVFYSTSPQFFFVNIVPEP